MEGSEQTQVLTRSTALPKNILPTGRQVGVVPVRGSKFYELSYVDGKPGTLPKEYQSRYTGIRYAENELKRFVTDFWDLSDKQTVKKKNAVS
jgi:hypothetical protein